MSRAICTNDIIMHIARNPRQVRIARKVQKAHIPRNMYPNGQNAMLCDSSCNMHHDTTRRTRGPANTQECMYPSFAWASVRPPIA